MGSAASIRSRDLGTLVRALPVFLTIHQLSPKGLHPPWLEAVSVYALAIWTTTLVPPSFAPLQGVPALPAFLPACDGQLQQDLSDGAGWFLPHVRIINVKSLNHILPPGAWLCYCLCLVTLAPHIDR